MTFIPVRAARARAERNALQQRNDACPRSCGGLRATSSYHSGSVQALALSGSPFRIWVPEVAGRSCVVRSYLNIRHSAALIGRQLRAKTRHRLVLFDHLVGSGHAPCAGVGGSSKVLSLKPRLSGLCGRNQKGRASTRMRSLPKVNRKTAAVKPSFYTNPHIE